MQKSYELFGNPEIALWLKKPEEMTLEELMDQMELKVQTQPALGILHHEFMAEGINSIKNGLKAFSLANNTNHNTSTELNTFNTKNIINTTNSKKLPSICP